jgi:hypothetical protein
MHPNDFAMERIRQAEAAKAEEKHDAAFASDLGLKPGEWPRMLVHEGRPLFRSEKPEYNGEGEVESYVYRAAGFRLVVWND